MNLDAFRIFQSSHRFSTAATVVLHVLMMGCLAIGYSQAVVRFVPGWDASHVVWIAMFIALEAKLSFLSQREKTFKERVGFHLAEWLVIMLVIQVVVFARAGFAELGAFLRLLQDSLIYFFHPEFLLTIFPMFLIWLLSVIMASDLLRLEVDVSELQLENPDILERDRRQIRRGMTERVFYVGLLLVILAFVTRLELVQLFGEIPPARAPVFNVVAYYVLALVLISQVQLSALRGHWLWSKAPIRSNVAGQWLKYSFVFFLVVALLTVLLPTQYSMPFLDTLGGLINVLGQVVVFLAFIVLWPIAQLINLLMSLLRPGSDDEPIQVEPPEMLAGEAGTPAAWWALIKSILFWTILIGVTGYFLVYYLRQNQGLWNALRAFPLLRWLGARLGAAWRWLKGVNRQLVAVIAAGRQMLFPSSRVIGSGGSRRPFDLRRASARQKVIFFYLRLVERGREEGLARGPGQTPLQYRDVLEQNLPEVEGELDGMTASFMEARYTRHEMVEEQAGEVQTLWKRILQALRGKKKRSNG